MHVANLKNPDSSASRKPAQLCQLAPKLITTTWKP
jgi:hypothetical protein